MKHLAKPIHLLAGAALALGLAAPLAAQDTAAPETGAETAAPEAAPEAAPVEKIKATADTVVAVVNGEKITLGHVIAARQTLPQQYQQLPDQVLLQALVDQLVQQTVLGQAAGEISRRGQIQLENERRSIIAGEKLNEVITAAVTDEKIKAAYDAEYANAEPTKEWNASHILVGSKDEAQAIIDELNGGADFAQLARDKSTGPSGPNGGELGWFGPGMMVKPFEDAVAAMSVGDISGPIQTQFGWHVVKLNDTRMKGAPQLEEVRDDIVKKLQNDAVQKALQTLLAAATIERTDLDTIDAKVISDPAMLE